MPYYGMKSVMFVVNNHTLYKLSYILKVTLSPKMTSNCLSIKQLSLIRGFSMTTVRILGYETCNVCNK